MTGEKLDNKSDVVCRICGKQASTDVHFYTKQQLCNRHYLQIRRHGDLLPVEKERVVAETRKCDVCGDENHNKYYVCKKDGEYCGLTLCGKHYNQVLTRNKVID